MVRSTRRSTRRRGDLPDRRAEFGAAARAAHPRAAAAAHPGTRPDDRRAPRFARVAAARRRTTAAERSTARAAAYRTQRRARGNHRDRARLALAGLGKRVARAAEGSREPRTLRRDGLTALRPER